MPRMITITAFAALPIAKGPLYRRRGARISVIVSASFKT